MLPQIIEIVNETPVVSHRVVAEYTSNKAVSIANLINRHKADFEEFGALHFKNEGLERDGRGEVQQKTFYLNEQQATLLFTYMQNSEIVRNFKIALVKAFYELRDNIPANNGVFKELAKVTEALVHHKQHIAQLGEKVDQLVNLNKISEELKQERENNIKMRQNIASSVAKYAVFTDKTEFQIWRWLYSEFRSLTNFDARQISTECGMSQIQVIESYGYLKQLLSLVRFYINEPMAKA